MNYTSGKEKLVHKKEAANRGFDHEGRERDLYKPCAIIAASVASFS
jgi:hypothetical protein